MAKPEHGMDLILTTGGTIMAPRDVTPEAALRVFHRQHSGLMELARLRCYEKTPARSSPAALPGPSTALSSSPSPAPPAAHAKTSKPSSISSHTPSKPSGAMSRTTAARAPSANPGSASSTTRTERAALRIHPPSRLVGGKSKRFGRDKLLNDRDLMARSLWTLQSPRLRRVPDPASPCAAAAILKSLPAPTF